MRLHVHKKSIRVSRGLLRTNSFYHFQRFRAASKIDAPAAISRVTNAIIKQSQSILSKKHSRCSFSNSSTSRSPSSSLKSSSLILLCYPIDKRLEPRFLPAICFKPLLPQTNFQTIQKPIHKIRRPCTLNAAATIKDRKSDFPLEFRKTEFRN